MKVFTSDEMLNPKENICIAKNKALVNEPPHTHEFIELVYIESGCGRQWVNDVSYNVKKGDMLFINYNQTHSIEVQEEMVYINFLLKPEFMSRELLNTENIYEVFSLSLFAELDGKLDQGRSMVSFRGKDMVELEHLIDFLLREFQEKQKGYQTIINGYMQVIFSKLLRGLKTFCHREIAAYMHKITPELLQYIDDNCFEKLSLADLAEKCFYNPTYFSRVFRECYGKPLTVYIREKRMAEAARLLTETELPAGQVGNQVGYEDKGQFYKLFKEHMGVTPGEYRKNQKMSHPSVKKIN